MSETSLYGVILQRCFPAMLRSYRHIIFALFGWLSLANAQGPTTQREQTNAGSNETQATTPVLLPPVQPVEPIEPSELYRPCENGEDARNSDLCAQWKAADAARDAANWTLWGVVLGVFGTLGLFWTLYYTRAAVKAAQDATRDADAANRIARSAADHQLRAYVAIEAAFLDRKNKVIRIHLKNVGSTPAYDFYVSTCVERWDTEVPSPQPHDFGIGDPGVPITGYIAINGRPPRDSGLILRVNLRYTTMGNPVEREASYGLANHSLPLRGPQPFHLIGRTAVERTAKGDAEKS